MSAIILSPTHLSPSPAIAASRARSIQWLLISTTLITLAVVSRAGMIAWPFLNDSGLYALMGRTVATGGVLYRDFYETKLPGAGLLTALFWLAFGPHWIGYVLCQLLMAIAASIVLFRIVPTLSTFLFAIVFLNLSQAVYTGFQLETIQAFFESLAALAAFRALKDDQLWASLASGMFAGLASMAKPGGIGIALAFVVVLILRKKRCWPHAFMLALGTAIPTAITLAYAIRSGAWPYLPGVITDIQHYSTGSPIGVESLLKLAVVFCVLGFPFAIRFLDSKSSNRENPGLFRLAAAWFIFDLIAVLAQRRLYPYHFLPLICPTALLYGMLPRRATPLSAALGLLPIALLSLTWEGSSISQLHHGLEQMPVSDYISAHTTPDDAVFSDQIGRLLIETNRQPGSRLGTFFYFVNDDQAPDRYCRTLLTDFDARQTKYLLLTEGWDRPVPGLANCDILQHSPKRRQNFIAAWAIFRKYVAAHYHLETQIDGIMIYRRSSVEHPANTSISTATPSGRPMD